MVERSGRTPCVERGPEQREGSEHVGLQERFRIGDRAVDMRLRGKMGDAGEFVFLEQPPHQRRIPDVALDEQDAAIGDQRFKAAEIGGIGHRIDDDQPVGRPRGAPCVNQVLADEAGTAGDQNALHLNLWVVSAPARWFLERGQAPPVCLDVNGAGPARTCGLPPATKLVIFAASAVVTRCYFLPDIGAYLVNERSIARRLHEANTIQRNRLRMADDCRDGLLVNPDIPSEADQSGSMLSGWSQVTCLCPWASLFRRRRHPAERSPGPLVFGVTFACLVAPHSVLVLFYGLTGSSGNSLVTGAFLVIATVAIGLLCFRRDIVLLPADYLFLALVLCILSSSAFNGWTSNAKEYQLIVISLAAYPACRFISRADIAAGRVAFIWATGHYRGSWHRRDGGGAVAAME